MSEDVNQHRGDLLTFEDGTQITRWEFLMEFYTDLPETYTVIPFADRTDLVEETADDVDPAAEIFEDDPEGEAEEDERYEDYEIDF